MDSRKRPRKQGGRGGAPWRRDKKAKSGPALPKSLMQEMGLEQRELKPTKKKRSSDDKRLNDDLAIKPRAKQPGDPLIRSTQDAVEAELQLQATLAKKLKLKQGTKLSGPDDGLDGLLKGLEDLNGSVPAGMPALPESDEEGPLLEHTDGLAVAGSDDDNDSSDDESLGSEDSGSLAGSLQGDLLQHESDDEDDDDEVAVDFGDEGGPKGGNARVGNCSTLSKPIEAATSSEEASDDDDEGSDALHDAEGLPEQRTPQVTEVAQKSEKRAGSAGQQKYTPPSARRLAAEAGAEADAPQYEAPAAAKEHLVAVQRKVRRLLNRVAVANLPGIASELAEVFNSAPRQLVASCVVASIMQAVKEGPRAADQFAAVTSCVLVMTSVVASVQHLLANAVLALAQALQETRASQDSIGASNIIRMFCFLYSCNGIDHRLMYSLLDDLKAGFSDGDVQLILLVLQTVGQQMRTAEPSSFKAFVDSLEAKMGALKAANQLSQRSRLMLELIVEMKNAKKIKEKHGAGSLESNLNADVMQQLRSCRVELVALHSLTWAQLTTGEHKGSWWLPAGAEGTSGAEGGPVRGAAGTAEADAVMQLAVAQRMNTDSRRAIFCILMSADDYMDAFERLLRLPLKGAAARDIAHVLVHCCMQEEQWNLYYALVAKHLMLAAKTYKASMQFALQDRLRHAHDLNARQASNLAELLAYLLAHKAVSLVVFKVLNLQQPTSRTTIFCRMCMQRLIRIPRTMDDLKKIFGSLQQARVRAEVLGVVRHVVRPWAQSLPDGTDKEDLLSRAKIVETVLKVRAMEAMKDSDGGRLLGENSSDDDEVDDAL